MNEREGGRVWREREDGDSMRNGRRWNERGNEKRGREWRFEWKRETVERKGNEEEGERVEIVGERNEIN